MPDPAYIGKNNKLNYNRIIIIYDIQNAWEITAGKQTIITIWLQIDRGILCPAILLYRHNHIRRASSLLSGLTDTARI